MRSYSNDKIEKYLDVLSEEYRELLLNRLLEVSDSIEDLKVSDLLKIDREIKKPLVAYYRNAERGTRVLLLLGLVYILLGLVMMVYFQTVETSGYDNSYVLAQGISLLGAIIDLVSILAYLHNRNKGKIRFSKNDPRNNRAIMEYSVVRKWRELEGIVLDLYSEEDIVTVKSLITLLFDDNYINENEKEELRKLLRIRNNIVYSNDDNYSDEEIVAELNLVEPIIKRLKGEL